MASHVTQSNINVFLVAYEALSTFLFCITSTSLISFSYYYCLTLPWAYRLLTVPPTCQQQCFLGNLVLDASSACNLLHDRPIAMYTPYDKGAPFNKILCFYTSVRALLNITSLKSPFLTMLTSTTSLYVLCLYSASHGILTS
jgi:hypothetical protein